MSKAKLVVSLAIAAAALIAVGWWAARTFWPMAPPASSAQMVAYAVMHQIAGGPVAIDLRLADVAPEQIKGPAPVSMPTAPFTSVAKKNKAKGDVVALLDVDASGSVAGIREMYSANSQFGSVANSMFDTMRTWKFKPATEKDKPVSAMVIMQLRF